MSTYRAKRLREEIAASIEQAEALLQRDELSGEARATLDRLQGSDDAPGEIELMTKWQPEESSQKWH